MSRHAYSDECDEDVSNLWAGAVRQALSGRRGQTFLNEMLAALDALPEKRLINRYMGSGDNVCAISTVAAKRGVDLSDIDEWIVAAENDEDEIGEDVFRAVSKRLGIAPAMAAEIMYVNDEAGPHDETDEQRWARMRRWIVRQIRTSDEQLPNGFANTANADR